MKIVISILILSFYGISLNAQSLIFDWAIEAVEGTSYSNPITLEVDRFGNTFTVGAFWGTGDFDPGPGKTLISSPKAPLYYLQKLDPQGDLLWVKTFGKRLNNDSTDAYLGPSFSLKISKSNHLYLTGNCNFDMDIDPGPNDVSIKPDSNSNVFVLKLDNHGNYLWSKLTGGKYVITASLNLDNRENLILAGNFTDSVDFDPGSNTYAMFQGPYNSYSGQLATFLQKLDSNGNFIWAKSFVDSSLYSANRILNVDIDSKNNLIVSGFFLDSMSFDKTTFAALTYSQEQGFIIKMDDTGKQLWNIMPKGYKNSLSAIVNNRDEIIATGSYTRKITLGENNRPKTFTLKPGALDIQLHFLSKIDTDGKYIWSNAEIESGTSSGLRDVKVNSNNDIFILGLGHKTDYDFRSSVLKLNPGSNRYTRWLLKVSDYGSFDWVKPIGEHGLRSTFRLHIDNNDNAYIPGYFSKIEDFDPGPNIHNLIPDSSNSALLLKLKVCNNVDYGKDTLPHSCLAKTWNGIQFDNRTQTAKVQFTNSMGCDSIVSVFMTGNTPIDGIDSVTACNQFTWLNGITYTGSRQSLVDKISYTNQFGCDSTIRLHLIINKPTTIVDSVVSCISYQWRNNLLYLKSDTSATHFIPKGGSNGCDITYKLNLTINHHTTVFDTIHSCVPYKWRNQVVYKKSNNSDTLRIINGGANGCDVTYNVNLTIPEIDTSVSTDGIRISSTNLGQQYQWLDCSNNLSVIPNETSATYKPKKQGSYAVEVSSQGCRDTSICLNVGTSAGLFPHENLPDKILAYPNPNNGTFTVDLSEFNLISPIQILNVQGQVVFESKTEESVVEIELNEPAGIYFLQMKNEAGSVIRKIIIE